MKPGVLAAIVKGLAPVVRDYVSAAIASTTAELVGRVKALEERAPVPGPPGPQGERGPEGAPGPAGPAGLAGERGPAGPEGKPGESGPQGAPGTDGAAGAPGERGPEGPAGPAGRDGLPGVPGVPGEKGLPGNDGRDGKDGRDGTLEQLKAVYDGERTVTFCFKNGDPIEGGVIRLPILIDRGVYREGTTYERGDAVTFGGSLFIAQCDTGAKPEASKDWRLSVKRGRDGKDGKEGPQGPEGKPGWRR